MYEIARTRVRLLVG